MRQAFLAFLGAAALGTAAVATRSEDEPSTAVDTGRVLRGKAVYEQNCAGCHGAEGRGDGAAAPYLFPRPRDFTAGLFKISSTHGGQLPTDEDLLHVVTNGMPGSAMPAWDLLSESDRRAVVEYVKSLTRFFDEDEGTWIQRFELDADRTPVEVPPRVPPTPESIARGRLVYRKADCVKCHGDGGRGDGVMARELKDSWGYEVRPRDLTAGSFKGGNDPVEIFKRITVGANGTPMPAHEMALTPAERWDVTNYVLSMARPGAQEMTRQTRRTIVAKRAAADPAWGDPAEAKWSTVPDVYVALMPLWWRDRHVEGVLVRAVHDGKNLYVHVRWDDATPNRSAIRSEDFRDGVAVQWARTDTAPFLAMGAGVEEVNLWMWKADRDAAAGPPQDVHTVYPNVDVLDYPETAGWQPGAFGAPQRPFEELGPAQAAGWAARNPVSEPAPSSPVENLAAHGFSTLSPLSAVLRRVEGRGVHDKGTWSVVMQRELARRDPGEAEFALGRRIPVAFAVWDGAMRDRNGQKSVSIWQDFEIEK